MKNWIIVAIVTVLIVAVALVAYDIGSKSAPISETPTAQTESNADSAASANTPVEVQKVFTIEIEDSAFNPVELKISVGSNVTWINKDTIPHTVTSDSGSRGGISSTIMDNSDKYTKQFLTAGTYSYHCNFHSSERGKIVVE